MRGFWLFVHDIGYSLWLGAGMATMIAGVIAKNFAPADRLSVYRVTSAVWRILVGPGAVAAVASGLVLAMPYMKAATMPGHIVGMMVLGLVGALVAVGLAVPTAARLGRLQLSPRGDLPEVFPALRKRLIWTATIAGGLAILALAATTFARY